MKQVTGNSNFAKPGRELSIQITLGGFSFCVSQGGKFLFGSHSDTYEFETILGDASRYSSVMVGWSTDAVVLIPQLIFEEGMTEKYLLAANMVAPETVSLANATLDKQIAAVWSVEGEIYGEIERLFPEAYHYHTIQVDVLYSELETVRVSVAADVANVVISGRDGLIAAESVRFEAAEDLLYFVNKLNMVDRFGRHSLEFVADNVEPYRKLFMLSFANSNFIQNLNFYHSKLLKCEL